MTELHQAQTRFVELMAELFQLDEAQSLDFGIYRIIRHRNRLVREFLGEIESYGEDKKLSGGKLQSILDAAFASGDAEAEAQINVRLRELETNFGISRHLTAGEREEKLVGLHAIPAMRASVDEYRSLVEQRTASKHGDDDRLEVLNRLHQFFDRHYQDGDFIVQRRYGRDGSRYIRSTGEDTEFRWATEDMYYIKSGDIFTDFPVTLANGARIVFAVEEKTLNETRAALKPNDKAHYQLKSVKKDGDGWRVLLDYAKGARTKAHNKAVVDAIVEKTGAQAEDTGRWLGRYIARNQSDFFIHKRLGEALNEELDIFLKTEVLDADQLLSGYERALRHARVAQRVREIGRAIIAFLSTLEDFQKALWEKKKLVLETRYVITLDRIEKLAGREWLEAKLPSIVKAQKKEWKELGLGNYAKVDNVYRLAQGAVLPLPIDTRNFDETFKWELLKRISSVDESLDGILLWAENWQALNTMQEKFSTRFACTYIDPPYNAPASLVAYKNSYKDASWLSLMQGRVERSKRLMASDSPMFVAIDDWEMTSLDHMLAREVPWLRRDVIVVNHHPQGSGGDNVSRTHEYMLALCPQGQSILYTMVETDGEEWAFMRSGTGDNNFRKGRYRSFYAILVDPETNEVKGVEPHPEKDADYPLGNTKEGWKRIYPLSQDGRERVWRLSSKSGAIAFANGKLRVSDGGTVYIKVHTKKSPVFSNWTDGKYNAGQEGTKLIEDLFGTASVFAYPKSLYTVKDAVASALDETGGWVLDYFGGSGTTAHAVMELGSIEADSEDEDSAISPKFCLVETNDYADTVILPRIKKVAAAKDWAAGEATAIDGRGVFVRFQQIERYEDTLENLALTTEQGHSGELPFNDAPTALRWKLDEETKRVYSATDIFRSPFGYTIRRAEGAGEAKTIPVDLVESLIWLLGLDIATLVREKEGVVITGKNRRDESVLVAFRECDEAGSGDWVMRLMGEATYGRVYTNAPADLAFPGAENLEAIETVFAGQFEAA
ncbi:MAG: hypothetical protein JSR50_06530 [Proteobacteria bacterium]|nr:hypothetical protein [Pseudomonadota bacterium]